MDKNYKGLIWTNHALEKMRKRGISQGDAWATWKNPDQSRYAKSRGAWIYYKTYPSAGSGQSQRIEVVAKKSHSAGSSTVSSGRIGSGQGKWIIISVWSKPVDKKKKSSKKKNKSFISWFLDRIFPADSN